MKVLKETHNHVALADFIAHLAYKIAFIFTEMRALIDALTKIDLPNA